MIIFLEAIVYFLFALCVYYYYSTGVLIVRSVEFITTILNGLLSRYVGDSEASFLYFGLICSMIISLIRTYSDQKTFSMWKDSEKTRLKSKRQLRKSVFTVIMGFLGIYLMMVNIPLDFSLNENMLEKLFSVFYLSSLIHYLSLVLIVLLGLFLYRI